MAANQAWMKCYRTVLCALAYLLFLFSKGESEQIAPFAAAAVLLISLGMIFLSSTKLLTLPFLLLCQILIFCYNSFELFIGYIWLAPIVLAAIAIHLWRLRPRFWRGESFWPLVAVGVATLVAGLGAIPASDYFRPIALFYVFALGPALPLVYLLLKNELRSGEDVQSFCDDLVALCLTATAMTFTHLALSLDVMLGPAMYLPPQWSNNMSTVLMLTFPLLFARARRRYVWLLAAGLAALAAMLSGSNGALLLVPVEVVVCTFWLWRTDEERPICRSLSRALFFAFSGAIVLAGIVFLTKAQSLGMQFSFRAREKLFVRGLENFRDNPIFGVGIGYLGNSDVYGGKAGTINWYHLFSMQVLGGMGLVGALAWGWQLFTRARLALRVWKEESFAMGLCYFGLFLMSQVNPGEFCPIPYAFLAVAFFAMIETVAKSDQMPQNA